MISKAKLIFIASVLVVGFAAPVFADCLESGAAESCGGGGGYGYYAPTGPGFEPYYRGLRGRPMYAPYE